MIQFTEEEINFKKNAYTNYPQVLIKDVDILLKILPKSIERQKEEL